MSSESRAFKRLHIPSAYEPSSYQKSTPVEPVCAKIERIISLERTNPLFIQDSSLARYVHAARGLGYFLNRINTSNVPSVVLDIGTGTGNALAQLAQEPNCDGISFIGTTLTESTVSKASQTVPIFVTPAEELRGILDKSVGGIISIAGIGFSDHPHLVAENMDRVLADGGLIKATFRKKGSYGWRWNHRYNQWGYNSHDGFSQALYEKGYDVAILETPDDDVMLATKPDGQTKVDAWTLLAIDNLNYMRMQLRGEVGHP
jgi:hypothetical protein